MIERCLRKDPNERFQNVSDFASALTPFGSAEGAVLGARAARRRSLVPEGVVRETSPPVPLVASNPTTGRTLSMVVSESTLPTSSRRAAVGVAIAMVAVLSGVALVGGKAFHRHGLGEGSSGSVTGAPTPVPQAPPSSSAKMSDVSPVAVPTEPPSSSAPSAHREPSLTSSTVKVRHMTPERPATPAPSQEAKPQPTAPTVPTPDDISNLRK